MPGAGAFTRVDAFVETYNAAHHIDNDFGHRFYRNGIAAYCSREGIPFTEKAGLFRKQLGLLRRVRHSARFRALAPAIGPWAIDNLARLLGANFSQPENGISRYLFHRADGSQAGVCIDAEDTGMVAKPDLLEWSSVYFKTNYWPGRMYPPKVARMANLNPWVFDNQEHLRQLRQADKTLDLFVFFRVWGGTDEHEGVEHNITLLETLARVKCRKLVMAYLVTGDLKPQIARLEKAGIPWTTKWMPMPELWKVSASTRLNLIRHGMHECIPWRMTDILAMGGCPVLDYRATTEWHVPLEENVHYLNLGIPFRPNEPVAFDPQEVIDRVEGWVADAELTRRIGNNTAGYFDQQLAPEALGEYIARTVASIG